MGDDAHMVDKRLGIAVMFVVLLAAGMLAGLLTSYFDRRWPS